MGNLGYAYQLLENLSFGVGGEFAYINLAEQEQTFTWAVNMGLLYNKELNNANFRMGVAGKNLFFNKVKFIEKEFDHERIYAVGAAFKLPFFRLIDLTVSGDASSYVDKKWQANDDVLYRLGSEALLLPTSPYSPIVRLGYKWNYDTEGFSVGAGIKINDNFQMDISYSDVGEELGWRDIGGGQGTRVSLAYHFGAPDTVSYKPDTRIIPKEKIGLAGFSTHSLPFSIFISHIEKTTDADVMLIGIQPGQFHSGISDKVKEAGKKLLEILKRDAFDEIETL